MPFHLLDAENRQIVAPAADDARRKPALHQMPDPNVRAVEIGRVDLAVASIVRRARFVRPAWIALRHVGIKSRDDLHHCEALALAIGGQRFEILGPSQPLDESHPPGIGQPEERRTVRVFEVPLIGSYA